MIKALLRDTWQGITTLIFPSLCVSCRRAIRPDSSPALCVRCYSDLGYTSHEKYPENEVTDRFAGRVPLISGTALLHFSAGTICQDLIHALKYHNRPEIGEELGRILGRRLLVCEHLPPVDAIIPVPIHPARRRQRGYNQSEHIAYGIQEVLETAVAEHALVRTSFKGSQTKLGNAERMLNVQASFAVGKGNFDQKHILLVDDVITTGATLDYCSQALMEQFVDVRISIAALAMAQK